MNKVTYWLRKVGMLRTSSYKVSGDAEKLNKIQASDGDMIQSPKEIDVKYKEQNTGQSNNSTSSDTPPNNDKKGSSSKALFWIFLVIGVSLCILILLMDFSVWFMFAVVMWAWFLHGLWSRANVGALMVGKTIMIGTVLVIVSLFFVNAALLGSEDIQEEYNQVVNVIDKKDVKQKENKLEEKSKSTDKISQFFVELEKETNIDFGQVADATGIVWTNGGAGLALQKAKEIKTSDASNKDWKLIKQYFEDNNGTHGTIGMVFTGEKNQDGYYFQDGEFKMLMCVLTDAKKIITVSCGWGPGGGK